IGDLNLRLKLLLLFIFHPTGQRAEARICMACNMFMSGGCVEGEGECTMEEGSACTTRDIYFSKVRGGFLYNHTVLECSKPCKPSRESYFHLKISSFCCHSQDFWNIYKGKLVNKDAN
uniref:UPAR/Ly6 domain-containing protein n=1 Tax=Peromyscus maniculatus bairdii TaxID=230844 RepID=A0A8C8W4H2_PERMB